MKLLFPLSAIALFAIAAQARPVYEGDEPRIENPDWRPSPEHYFTLPMAIYATDVDFSNARVHLFFDVTLKGTETPDRVAYPLRGACLEADISPAYIDQDEKIPFIPAAAEGSYRFNRICQRPLGLSSDSRSIQLVFAKHDGVLVAPASIEDSEGVIVAENVSYLGSSWWQAPAEIALSLDADLGVIRLR